MQPNELIAGRYQIIEPLGEGGMANVYRAHDQILDRDVSVKLLRLDLRDDDSVRQRFVNEIAASTELVHPNIIQVYDFGETNQLQYLVTEYVAGEDLKQYISSHHPLTITRTLEIMSDILAGVAMAHSHNIIHRDLKPQNILIDHDGRAKITDFGIATAQSSLGLTKADVAIGSIHYMSPEQVKGGMATTRSDIYALGIMLYEMLVGTVPFDAPEAVSVALMHSTEAMPFVRDTDPRIPQALENVILKATQKNALNRYSSVEEMRDDLSTVMSPERLSEPRFSTDEQPEVAGGATKIVPETVVGAAAASLMNETEQHQSVKTAKSDQPVKRDKYGHIIKYDKKGRPIKMKKNGKPKSKLRFLWWLIGGVAAVLALFLLIGAFTPDKVTISNFSSGDVSAAKLALKQDGLKVGTVYYQSSETVKKDYVIKTNPKAGQKVTTGSKVDIYVSTGLKKVRFGDYAGEKYSRVASKLRTKGYRVKEVKQYSDDVPEGYIISQSLDAEENVAPSKTEVTFTVSQGQKMVVIEDFSNKTRDYVNTWAKNNGVIVSFNETASDSVAENHVISQSVKSGTKITDKDVVTITISTGSDSVEVPDFSGKTLDNVNDWAQKNGVNIQAKSDVTSLADAGKITSQSVVGGDRMPKGNTLTVTVSAKTKTSN
ncbi:Stk1 family PASTA domain-containing Ser/Thr kinase [Weissella diestrammenae]|uniref:non-specific serine/threonine protein kinase n=1 Tax=Weissella diestrammenae TaxID=1162633 RepID=A0A7G9T508_9LACO|nr:Stk1 family PASTA domain-containing Ser/Thr kinase [Weissella diestrammenae]MCM0582905.1 Stk1 family PASTA domain-containing Ser/Thr kinase [Weissella diestrammenae]QNN75183.1 Stk1 family PASTA domain-containing Ser/Thr kinase [Weissella diestrammenae]